MPIIDKEWFEIKCIIHKVNKTKIAKEMGIARETFWRKRKGIADWTASELRVIVKMFHLKNIGEIPFV